MKVNWYQISKNEYPLSSGYYLVYLAPYDRIMQIYYNGDLNVWSNNINVDYWAYPFELFDKIEKPCISLHS